MSSPFSSLSSFFTLHSPHSPRSPHSSILPNRIIRRSMDPSTGGIAVNGSTGSEAKPQQSSSLSQYSLPTRSIHADDYLNASSDVAPPLHVSTTFRYTSNPAELLPAAEVDVKPPTSSPNLPLFTSLPHASHNPPTCSHVGGIGRRASEVRTARRYKRRSFTFTCFGSNLRLSGHSGLAEVACCILVCIRGR